jgi:hypothetical protein
MLCLAPPPTGIGSWSPIQNGERKRRHLPAVTAIPSLSLPSWHAGGGDGVRIRQYVYFALSSETVTAAEVTARLGVEPDELRVRGSKRVAPRIVPANHSWSVHCRDRGLGLDAQTQKVLERLEPIRAKLIDLVTTENVTARLTFVRYFEDEDGEEELFEASITEDGEFFERLPGQHQLLGWYLPAEQLTFLAGIRAAVWADEHG